MYNPGSIFDKSASRHCRLSIHIRLTANNDVEVENTYSGEPLQLSIGDGTLNENIECLLYGMHVGERKVVTLEPQQAFGMPDVHRVFELSRDDFSESISPEIGKVIGFSLPAGDEIEGRVLNVTADTIKVDFNHPLAGWAVGVDITLIAICQV